MKPIKIASVLLSCVIFTSCGTSTTGVISEETTTSETTIKITEEETTELSEVTTTTSEETVQSSEEITESSEETTETEFTTSLPYFRTIDFDGKNIPDGTYMIRPLSVDKDRRGFVANIYGFYFLLEEDLEYLKEGDVVYFESQYNPEMEEHVCCSDNEQKGYLFDYCWELQKQADNTYIIGEFDTGQFYVTYLLAENYHIDVSENIYIFDGLPIPPFNQISEDTHQAYLDGKMFSYTMGEMVDIPYEDEAVKLYKDTRPEEQELGASFQYRSIDDFVFAYNELSLAGAGVTTLCIVNSNTIVEMYLNPALHQPWRFVDEEARDERRKNFNLNEEYYKKIVID